MYGSRPTSEQQAALVDLLIEHYDATGVSDGTREEAQDVAAVVLAAGCGPSPRGVEGR